MSASAVVPTRDRPLELRRCLASLSEQSPELELIVVDDASVAAETVEGIVAEFGAKLVRLDGRGPAAARNAGVAVASGEYILLLDDDCVALPGWSEALVSAAAATERSVVAGTVTVPPGSGAWLRASECLAEHAESAAGFFRSLNLCSARELLLELRFDERFRAAAGEDRDWCFRAARAGATFDRVPQARVEHRADLGPRTFVAQQVRYGRAIRVLRTKDTHERMPVAAVWRGLLAGFAEEPAVGLAMLAAHVAASIGYLAEWIAPSTR